MKGPFTTLELKALRQMAKDGKATPEIALKLHRSPETIRSIAKRYRIKLAKALPKRKPYQEGTELLGQLCWHCIHAVPRGQYGCEWSRSFQPVPGWDAEIVGREKECTYSIRYCPKFRELHK